MSSLRMNLKSQFSKNKINTYQNVVKLEYFFGASDFLKLLFYYILLAFCCTPAFCCNRWVLLSSCSRKRLLSSCSAQVSQGSGFSCSRAWAVKCRLSNCGTGAQLPLGMWILPGPGIKPVSPAQAERSLVLVISSVLSFYYCCDCCYMH